MNGNDYEEINKNAQTLWKELYLRNNGWNIMSVAGITLYIKPWERKDKGRRIYEQLNKAYEAALNEH